LIEPPLSRVIKNEDRKEESTAEESEDSADSQNEDGDDEGLFKLFIVFKSFFRTKITLKIMILLPLPCHNNGLWVTQAKNDYGTVMRFILY